MEDAVEEFLARTTVDQSRQSSVVSALVEEDMANDGPAGEGLQSMDEFNGFWKPNRLY